MASQPNPPGEQKHIILIGAGITALSTSLALHASKDTSSYTQIIIATHLPGDKSVDYTSPWAGGHWRSFASLSTSDAELRGWDKKTYEAWRAMLGACDGDGFAGEEMVGLGVRESRNYWGEQGAETEEGGKGLWWSARRERGADGGMGGGVEGFEVLDLEEERRKEGEKDKGERVPDGAVFGVEYQSVCINIPQYLNFMLRRVKEEGTRVIQRSVDTSEGLPGVVKHAKKILIDSDPSIKEENIFAIINCTGLSTRHFVGAAEAAKLFPIRGQTILVQGEASKARTYVDFGEKEELMYVIPRPGSGTTILGGCKQVGNWSAEVDGELNERILGRVRDLRMAEELKGEGGGFEVLSYQVGLRPGRKGGARVEKEEGGKVEGCWVVHSYGQGGGGYQCSIGCAERVAEIVGGLS